MSLILASVDLYRDAKQKLSCEAGFCSQLIKLLDERVFCWSTKLQVEV